MSNEAVTATSGTPAVKRRRLDRPPPISVPFTSPAQRTVVFGGEAVFVQGSQQPNLRVSVSGCLPPTRDTVVQATAIMKDFATQANPTEINDADTMYKINCSRFDRWVKEVIPGAWVRKPTPRRCLPSPIQHLNILIRAGIFALNLGQHSSVR